jgi:hypothetical protein
MLSKYLRGEQKMGCIVRILQIIILIFAYIGFQSVGGMKFFETTFNDFTKPSEENTIVSAKKILDVSKLSNDYVFTKAYDVFGMKVIEAEYQKAPQKIYIIDSKGLVKISKEDFYDDKIGEILENLLSKFAYQAIRIENLKIIRSGNFVAMNKQKIPYIIFEADIIRGNTPKMFGMLGVTEGADGENDIILSFTTTGKYNQTVTENFFHQVNYKEADSSSNEGL